MDEDLEEEATPPRLTAAQNSRQNSLLSGKRSAAEDAEEDGATPPPPKRKKFFAKDEDSGDDDDVAVVVKNEVVQDAAANTKKSKTPVVVELLDDESDSDGDEPVASTSKASARPATPPKPRVPRNGRDFKSERYFGTFTTDSWATTSSSKDVFKTSKKVTIERPAVSAVTLKKHATASTSTKEKDANAIVRYRNNKGMEIGRIDQKNATWMAKAMDLGFARFEGTVVEAPAKLSSGLSTIKLSIKAYIQRSAFMSIQNAVDLTAAEPTEGQKEKAKTVQPKAEKAKPKKATVIDETKDTEAERLLKARKVAINRLFDKVNLKPIFADEITKKHKKKGKMDSKRALLEHYDGTEQKLKEKKKEITKSKAKDAKGKGKAKAEEDEPAPDEMSENQVNEVFAKAVKHDANLPEMDPPATFALKLRPYQKQALHWMSRIEGGVHDAREELTMHPLWEEYNFPTDSDVIDLDAEEEPFFYNPYSGELSLEFPKASKQLRGGILADEMGLGKTIMVASLIHANMPNQPRRLKSEEHSSSSSDNESYSGDDSEKPYVPSPVAKQKRQSKLNLGPVNGSSSKARSAPARAGRYNATLVIAPTSLLNQWRDELVRSSKGNLQVLVYNDQKDISTLVEELDGGVDVVVASYGKVGVEYDKWAGEDGKGFARKPKEGIYCVDWFRVILDEAHTIKSRSTRAARACYAIKGKRRWCLSGTPIVNRLEDLYSLLHFIRCEPWGNWAFFNTFVTIPFQNKDPMALKTIQVVLEGLLLRREKSMKDRDGNPIVPLPKKRFIMEELELAKEERAIYDKVYEDAKTRYLTFAENGTVKSNTIAILAIITRLRQACLHPSLLLKAGSRQNDPSGQLVRRMVGKWVAKFSSASNEDEVLERMNEEDEDSYQSVCMLCDSLCEGPVFFPCEHSGCRDCMLSYLNDGNGGKAVCPNCEDGTVYTQADLHQAVKQEDGFGTQASIIELDDSDDDGAADRKPNQSSGASKPLFRARSQSSSSGRERSASTTASGKRSSKSQTPAVENGMTAGTWLDQSDFVASTKIKAVIEHLLTTKAEEPKFHAVVFSQFTSFLDLMETALKQAKLRFVRLDGTMDRKQRDAAVKQFNNKDRHCVFIISLKAGGTGLNLTVANRIYVTDWWWNRATEDQAIDRVHRFGQEREVFVYRFLIKRSIEGKMKALQAKKTAVINASLGNGSQQGIGIEDFNAIFADD